MMNRIFLPTCLSTAAILHYHTCCSCCCFFCSFRDRRSCCHSHSRAGSHQAWSSRQSDHSAFA